MNIALYNTMGVMHEYLSRADTLEEQTDEEIFTHKQKQLAYRAFRKNFAAQDESKVTGRPHHLLPWQAGVETHLGYRRM